MSPETQEYVDEMKKIHGEIDLISKGSSLKLCMVAEGTADATRDSLRPWNGTQLQGQRCVKLQASSH